MSFSISGARKRQREQELSDVYRNDARFFERSPSLTSGYFASDVNYDSTECMDQINLGIM